MDWLIALYLVVAALIFVYLIAAPLFLIAKFRYRQWRTRHAVAPSSRVVPPQADGAPPPYLFATGCAANSRGGPSDTEVVAGEHYGTTKLTIVRMNGRPVGNARGRTQC